MNRAVEGGWTYHDNKGKAVVENQPKRMAKLLEPIEFRTLEDSLEHGFDDEPDVIGAKIIGQIETDKSLQETNVDNDEQGKEDDRLLHHDFENDEHGAKEAEAVEIEQETGPKQGRHECQEIVAQPAEMDAIVGATVVGEANEAQDKRGREKRVQESIKGTPESQNLVSGLVDLDHLVADKSNGEQIEQNLGRVEIARWVDRVDGHGVEGEVHDGEKHLRSILIHGGTHAIRVKVHEKAGVGLVLVIDKDGRIVFVLNKPASPEVANALLVARGANDPDVVKVDRLFNHIGRRGWRAVGEDRVSPEQHSMEQVIRVLLRLDAAERQLGI
jgi:hypothetical protein